MKNKLYVVTVLFNDKKEANSFKKLVDILFEDSKTTFVMIDEAKWNEKAKKTKK